MLSLIPAGTLIRLFFPLVFEQLRVIVASSRIIAPAALRIRPQVDLLFSDHGSNDPLLRDAADALIFGLRGRRPPGSSSAFPRPHSSWP